VDIMETLEREEEKIDTHETRLFHFMLDELGLDGALHIMETFRNPLGFLRFTKGVIDSFDVSVPNDRMIRQAITSAIGRSVYNITQISFSLPTPQSHGLMESVAQGNTTLDIFLANRFEMILRRKSEKVAEFNYFAQGCWIGATTQMRAAIQGYVFPHHLLGSPFKSYATKNIFELFRYYLSLAYAKEPAAENLRELVQILPTVIPLCHTRNNPQDWIVLVP
jgi:hypothetical protein